MDGIEPEEEFKQEAFELLNQLENTFLNLEKSPDNGELIDSAFRKLHSLKGAAMMFSWDTMAMFIHQVETTLAPVCSRAFAITEELVALALLIIDHIRGFLAQPENIDLACGTSLLDTMTKLTTEQPHTTKPIKHSFPASVNAIQKRIPATLDEWSTIHSPTKIQESILGGDTLRVPREQINQLMDQIAELVIAQERLDQAMTSETDPFLKSIAGEIRCLATGLRDTAITLRRLPIGTLFRRFRRVVHDLSHELGKTVDLTLAGEATTLDKFLIERLHDPLLHLIRNSIAHGIESPHQRLAAGKLPNGQLHLEASHSAESVVITLEDDGHGLNCDAIRAKAEEYGLLWPGQEVSTTELFNYIFYAGFSTARQVTHISGRGIGLDVVKRTIDELHGTIELKDNPGKGLGVILKLPYAWPPA